MTSLGTSHMSDTDLPTPLELLSMARRALESLDIVLVDTDPGPGQAGILISVQAGSLRFDGSVGISLELMDPEYGATCRITSPHILNITRRGCRQDVLAGIPSEHRIAVRRVEPTHPNTRYPGLPVWEAVHPVYPPPRSEDHPMTTSSLVSVKNLAAALIASSTALEQMSGREFSSFIDIRVVSQLVLSIGDQRNLAPLGMVEKVLDILSSAASGAVDSASQTILTSRLSASPADLRVMQGASARASALMATIDLAKMLLLVSSRADTASQYEPSTAPLAVPRDGLLDVLGDTILGLSGTISEAGVVTDNRGHLASVFWENMRVWVRTLQSVPGTHPSMVRLGDLELAVEKSLVSAQNSVSGGPLSEDLEDESRIIRATAGALLKVLSLPCPALESDEERRSRLLDSLEGLTLPEIAAAIADRSLDDRMSIMVNLYARAEHASRQGSSKNFDSAHTNG